ncbi:hypothetical protein CIHG_02868 [Coccidioides immitis H538.4]|uniref:Uncharacterized protein n=3 Tax=Coccidioides immitis TaxID=5501 RepID=A0A0J8U0H9_COCIT|nr:hypothetical protein CIRG_07581 [Coccidioides immitis RMSCC 2394]KMU79737.1 hypothetical protein CISG_08017 [Coccidioides immitis RMSCC 3703]KMU85085.1 hypothetical protein CIHG_02868 [Coccidioides immitis H538.4]
MGNIIVCGKAETARAFRVDQGVGPHESTIATKRWMCIPPVSHQAPARAAQPCPVQSKMRHCSGEHTPWYKPLQGAAFCSPTNRPPCTSQRDLTGTLVLLGCLRWLRTSLLASKPIPLCRPILVVFLYPREAHNPGLWVPPGPGSKASSTVRGGLHVCMVCKARSAVIYAAALGVNRIIKICTGQGRKAE